jgi:hypothetical protein
MKVATISYLTGLEISWEAQDYQQDDQETLAPVRPIYQN